MKFTFVKTNIEIFDIDEADLQKAILEENIPSSNIDEESILSWIMAEGLAEEHQSNWKQLLYYDVRESKKFRQFIQEVQKRAESVDIF